MLAKEKLKAILNGMEPEIFSSGTVDLPTLKKLRQKQDIDYNKEIPFKRDVPEFVYKTEESETPKNVGFASTITLT